MFRAVFIAVFGVVLTAGSVAATAAIVLAQFAAPVIAAE